MTPLLVFLALSFFGRFVGYKGAAIIAASFSASTAIFSFVVFYYVGILGNITSVCLGTWIDCGLLVVNWGFVFDSLTAKMLTVVNTVSALVQIYSVFYKEKDPHFTRFMAYLSLFTFFMLVLVSADIRLFLGWEGVGLAPYLLIAFWNTRVQANKAALKATVLNRLGDFSLIFAILLIFFYFKSVDFAMVFLLIPLMSEFFFVCHWGLAGVPLHYSLHILSFICFWSFIGAAAKSARVGLHTWLPDAMEGPTPVSALIHAATMVTAGVFLIDRCSPFFECAPGVLTIMVFVGSTTATYSFQWTFFDKTNIINIAVLKNDLELPIGMATTLAALAFCSIFGEYFLKDIFVEPGTGFFRQSLRVKEVSGGGARRLFFLGRGRQPRGPKYSPPGWPPWPWWTWEDTIFAVVCIGVGIESFPYLYETANAFRLEHEIIGPAYCPFIWVRETAWLLFLMIASLGSDFNLGLAVVCAIVLVWRKSR
jgi:hypothetical protein